MARRRSDYEGSNFTRKLYMWAAVLVFVIWAARDPAGAAALIRLIGEGIASGLQAVDKHTRRRRAGGTRRVVRFRGSALAALLTLNGLEG